jgi:hypothetical protein
VSKKVEEHKRKKKKIGRILYKGIHLSRKFLSLLVFSEFLLKAKISAFLLKKMKGQKKKTKKKKKTRRIYKTEKE